VFDKSLVLKIFEGFSIERWNDLVRPFELIEMDKTAEKTVLAYIIGKYEEKRGNAIEWDRIIYGSLFDLLRKIALCDIKAPVLRMIRAEYPAEYARLNEWVVSQYRSLIQDNDLFDRFSSYVLDPSDPSNLTVRVFRAAHKYSTIREIEMIRMVNEPFRLVDIDRGINKDLEEFLDLRGLQLLVAKQQPWEFLTEIEKLRFQTRWNQTPRVPATSVLGHSYFVAALTLLMGRDLGITTGREYNNFFSALFHDLPEAVTRDIISPVKQATLHLPAVVKEVEDKIVERELLPLMDASFRDELVYFTSHEFENRIFENGRTRIVDFAELQSVCSLDSREDLRPIDGKLVRAADHIAAFVEADCSISYGITSSHLRDGKKNILSMYPEGKTVNDIDVAAFFRTFS
jgi:putative hydrolase of HD superfamily